VTSRCKKNTIRIKTQGIRIKRLDEVKDQIRSQLFQENVNLKARDWIEQLKNNANIRYFVKF